MDVSTKLSSVACKCVKVQWLESKESTLIHQPINFINSVNVAHMKENKHIEKQTWGETSTVGGETSNEWAKRPGGEKSWGRNVQGAKRPGGETSRGRNVLLPSWVSAFALSNNNEWRWLV